MDFGAPVPKICLLAPERCVVGGARAGGETSIPGALGARILHMPYGSMW